MPILTRFDLPARLEEPTEADRDAWSGRVAGLFRPAAAAFPQFYDPTVTDTPDDAARPSVVWRAFPATLLQDATSQEQRWRDADASRDRQDEYCEWGVERDATGKVTRVTFTSEVPEYYEHLAARDPARLVSLYEELLGTRVDPQQLITAGRYRRDNPFNHATSVRPVHLRQRNNNLGAAVTLAAEATILRHDAAGEPLTTAMELVICGRLGNPSRNSDPQIAAAVNDAAASGAEISLQDPVGLYIDGLLSIGMQTPDGEDPAAFWTIERGDPGHVLRASYRVPPERGYQVGDILLEGRPITFGAQLADRVGVRLTAVVRRAGHRPRRRPCEA